MKSMMEFLSQFIYARWKSSVIVNIAAGFKISTTTKLKGAYLTGKVSTGAEVKLIDGVTIQAGSDVFIDSYTAINGPNTDIINKLNPVRIGKFCSIARGVQIQEFNHAIDRPSTYFMEKNIFKKSQHTDIFSNGPINIGHDVWIGAQCVILGGAQIGNGAVIAANSVVIGEIPPYAIAGGSPAKVLKFRFEKDIIDRLLALGWWSWPVDKIKKNEVFFTAPVTHDTLDNIR